MHFCVHCLSTATTTPSVPHLDKPSGMFHVWPVRFGRQGTVVDEKSLVFRESKLKYPTPGPSSPSSLQSFIQPRLSSKYDHDVAKLGIAMMVSSLHVYLSLASSSHRTFSTSLVSSLPVQDDRLIIHTILTETVEES